MKLKTIALLVLVLMAAKLGKAQVCVTWPIPDSTAPTFLVPLLFERQPGAFNSLWTAEATIYNPNLYALDLLHDCVVQECGHNSLNAQANLNASPTPSTEAFPGRFYSIRASAGADPSAVVFQLRIFDEHSTVPDFGTYVPVPRWDLLKPGRLVFTNVPTDTSVRLTLRLFSNSGGAAVRVYFYDYGSGAFVAERDVQLNGSTCLAGYAQLASADMPNTALKLRVDVQSVDPSVVLWGLLSVTSADNRQITVFPSTTVPRQ